MAGKRGMHRSTDDELFQRDAAIVRAVEEDKPVSLRGVFYRVVSAGLIEKTEAGCNKIGRRLLLLRRGDTKWAGEEFTVDGDPTVWRFTVAYEDIVDGTRSMLESDVGDASLEEFVRTIPNLFRLTRWANQPRTVIVVSEKDAITSVIERVIERHRVPFGVARGYGSETFAWRAAERIRAIGKPTTIFQLGDHDPSGVDAWRDFRKKISGFAPDIDFKFERLAVTPQQIVDMDLPTRPTKGSDSRAGNFDGESVEVDAIPATTLRALVDEAISREIDHEKWAATEAREEDDLARLRVMLERRNPTHRRPLK